MSNAHDEAWSVVRKGFELEILSDTDGPSLIGYDPRQVGVWPEQDIARVTLISAAPEMARALLGVFGSDLHLADCSSRLSGRECSEDCANARSALKKAGVIR